MNLHLTLRIQGGLLIFLAAMLLTPLPFSLAYPRAESWHDGAFWAFLLSALIALAVGVTLHRYFRAEGEMTYREGFAIVTFGWIAYALFGGLPYLLADVNGVRNFADAFFEAMSGFSTTGATVITGLDHVVAKYPVLASHDAVAGRHGHHRAEPGHPAVFGRGRHAVVRGRIAGADQGPLESANSGHGQGAVGRVCNPDAGRDLPAVGRRDDAFESLCHAFTTMATGGFSTRDASIAAFGSYTQVVIGLFMLLAGVNFSLHFHALRGEVRRYWESEEFRFYLAIVASSTAVSRS